MPSAVHVKNLSVYFDGKPVLENISLDIDRGQIAAIIGPNGSGKTTLLKTMLGLVEHQAGTVLFFDQPLDFSRGKIGYVPQRFNFQRDFPITVLEFLNLAVSKPLNDNFVADKLKEVGLSNSISTSLLGTLSSGQLQRVLITQAILNSPEILLLDEPSAGIDIVGEAEFYEIIKALNKNHGTTVLLVSHDVFVVSKFVDQVICINKRLLCSGPPQVTLTEQKMTELYGKHTTAYKHKEH